MAAYRPRSAEGTRLIIDDLTQGEIEDIFGNGRSLLLILRNTIRLTIKANKQRRANAIRSLQVRNDGALQE